MNSNRIPMPVSKLLFPTLLIISTLLITGCSSDKRRVIQVDEARVKEFAQRGYDSGIDYATADTRFSMKYKNEFIQITSVHPKREGKYPLVIYLPGLGESSDAGSEMRHDWAKSGYVVLSLQTLKDDEDIWSSDSARRADFSDIRKERYSSGTISRRLDALTKLFEYLKLAAVSGDENARNIDLSEIAIIGFDVGASTAMISGGESVQNLAVAGFPVTPKLVIALSPHVDSAESASDARYQNINIPVLSVTSNSDDETHENDAVSLHQLPFQHMPPGNKYLLMLVNASHSLIGGGAATEKSEIEDAGESKRADHDESVSQSRRGRGGRHGSRGTGAGEGAGSSSRREEDRSPTQRAKAKVAIEQVTTAFLNAYLKKDRFAIDWIKNDAQPWLYGTGELEAK